jgi:TonB-dependent starch-binding outer membrane protein SusC
MTIERRNIGYHNNTTNDLLNQSKPMKINLPERFAKLLLLLAMANAPELRAEPLQDKQGLTISGTVTSSDDQSSLPGVNVLIKGTTVGTTTDADGAYTIIANRGDILLFTFIGYRSQEVTVDAQTSVNIALEADVVQLGDVVVIGYGTVRRQDYTGSVGSVNLENSPVSLMPNLNALETLKGNVAGLSIGATTTAGGEPSMLIRGQNSISGSNNPLIVLDGVIYLGNLNDINPNDIATIDILKDAASAAAYGSRSANGVIAITTKKGKTGKPVISFNTSAGVQSWQNKPVMMKGEEWVRTINARNKNPEGTTSWLKPGELANMEAGKETVWLDEVTRTGIFQDYQASISGAGEHASYYLSSTYSQNKGIVIGDDFNRISVLGKVNTAVTDWLEMGLDVGYTRKDYSGFAANVGEAQTMSPYGVMYRDDRGNLEKYPYTQSAINPLWGVRDGTRDNMDVRQNFRLNTYAVVSVPWVQGLSYRINFLTNQDKDRSGNFYYEDYYVTEGEGLSRYEPSALTGFLTNANGNLNSYNTSSYVIDNIVSYKNTFGKHSFDVTLVATRDHRRYEEVIATGSNFSANGNTTLGMWGLHKATVQKTALDVEERSNIGYLGRLSYSFNDKYFFTSSYRRDGASVFGANNKWAHFAAFGAAWKISNEPFMAGLQSMDNLKLKLTWGQNGNQGIAPYATLSTIANGSSSGYMYEFSNASGVVNYGMIQNALGNSDLGWETTETWNGGFESAWLSNRIFLDVDLYFSQTTDQIFTRNIPVMTGFKTVLASLGQVNNTGVEVTLRAVNQIRSNGPTFNTAVTFWKNNNRLVRLYGEDNDGDGKEDDDISNALFIGRSLGAIYGFEQNGIVQESDTEYMAMTGTAPGAPKYKDLDGVPGITADDRKILGYTKENFRLNLSNTISFKNFDLYTMFTGTFGGNNFFMKSNYEGYRRFNDNTTPKPYWTPENPGNSFPAVYFAGDGRYLQLQSRGFVRIQDIALAYTFNQPWVNANHIRSLKVFLSVKNLATFTDWMGGDPETGTTIAQNTFPVATTYSIGANVSF